MPETYASFRSAFDDDERIFVPLVSKVLLSNAEVLQLYTTPAIIVEGHPGYTIIPQWTYIQKPAGTAFTLGTATELRFIPEGTAATGCELTMANFMDQSDLQIAMVRGPGTASILFTQWAAHNANGMNMILTVDNENITAGDVGLKIIMQYLKVPAGE